MPAKTDKQAITARIAGAIKKGLQKGKPGEPSTEMAKMPMKSLKKFMHTKKDKKVKKEGVIENARFFGVRKPSGEIAEKDMVFEFNPLEGVQPLNIDMKDVHTVATDETQAREIAAEAYSKYCNEVQALEEKKGKVGDKLKKTIDHLEKKRKEHVDMAKEDPKNASQHKEHIAKLASQIDDLMSKMEKIEKSKKNVEKKEDLKESSLSAGNNLKVGDKIVNTKRPQTLTVTKIDGDNISIESDILPGKTFKWPKDAVDQGIKSGELRWQPIAEVEVQKGAGKVVTYKGDGGQSILAVRFPINQIPSNFSGRIQDVLDFLKAIPGSKPGGDGDDVGYVDFSFPYTTTLSDEDFKAQIENSKSLQVATK